MYNVPVVYLVWMEWKRFFTLSKYHNTTHWGFDILESYVHVYIENQREKKLDVKNVASNLSKGPLRIILLKDKVFEITYAY